MTEIIRIRGTLLFMLAALASGGAAAQSTTDAELKSKLDQALRTIQDLQKRVTTLEQQQKTAPAVVVPAPRPHHPPSRRRPRLSRRRARPRRARRMPTRRRSRFPAR